jgi:hypothetical protein
MHLVAGSSMAVSAGLASAVHGQLVCLRGLHGEEQPL